MTSFVDSALDRGMTLRDLSHAVEEEAIARAVSRYGSQRRAADALGLTERALQLRRQRAKL